MYTQQLRCAKMFSRTELNYPQEVPILLGSGGGSKDTQFIVSVERICLWINAESCIF